MILIKSVQIIDGSGKPAFRGDILIKDDRISAVSNFIGKKADTIIDGLGLTAVPGFIDVNTDSDHYLSLFSNPLQKDFLLQGVTTIIGGQCGASLAPLLYGSLRAIRKWGDVSQMNIDWNTIRELKEVLKRLKLGVNFGTLVGYVTIRRDLVGSEIRDLTQPEIEIFQHSLFKALDDGALGLSTGLGYSHSRNISYSEIKKILTVFSKKPGVYTTHLRDEQDNLIESVRETIQMAQESGLPTIISHFRPILGFESKFQEALKIIEESLDKGNIYFDVNPFDMSVLPIYTLLPVWAQEGGFEGMLKILGDELYRPRIISEISKSDWVLDNLVIAEAQGYSNIIDKTLKEFSDNRDLNIIEGLLLLMEITRMHARFFYKNINQRVLEEVLSHPRALIGSNSASLKDQPSVLRPKRATETFGRFLEIMEQKKAPIEDSIKRITSVPAKIFNISKRGLLQEGWFADVVLLKDKNIAEVIVNGRLAVSNGKVSEIGFGSPL
ncbi:MAG: hypothetical protein Q7S73_02380 [bacterium]|nr:hypothetical protein [bacterium]